MAPVDGRRAGRAAKPRLSRDAVVDAALRLLDAESLDAVSMRRVAKEFATGAASLYAHVANREELLGLVVDRVLGEFAERWPGTEPTPQNWRALTADWAHVFRQTALAHQDVAKAFSGRTMRGPNGLRALESQLAVMRAGGLPDRMAVFAVDLIRRHLIARAIEDAARRRRFHDAAGQDVSPVLRDHLESLPAQRFPNTVALAGPLTRRATAQFERYDYGLELLIRGIAALAARPSSPTACRPILDQP
jgi:AcrR family transcriptional regulator